MAVANEAVVKHFNYIQEMSQNYEYFNRRGVTKCGCGCTLMFHLYTVHVQHCTFVHNTQNSNTSLSTSELHVLFIYLFCFSMDYYCLPSEIVLFGDCSA